MRRLTAAFILDHLEDHLLVAINHMFWLGTSFAFMNHVLEEDEHPSYSETFYTIYGNDLVNKSLDLVYKEDYPTMFLDLNVSWGQYLLDLLDFVQFCPGHLDVKQAIAEAFINHYDDVVMDEDEREQESYRRLVEEGDTRLARFFRLRDILHDILDN